MVQDGACDSSGSLLGPPAWFWKAWLAMHWRERCNSPLRLGKRYLVLSWAVTLFGKASSSRESGQADSYQCVMSWGSGRSLGEVNDNLLRYACLGNPMDRGACWTTIHGITKSQTRLSNTCTHTHTHTHTHMSWGLFLPIFLLSFIAQVY